MTAPARRPRRPSRTPSHQYQSQGTLHDHARRLQPRRDRHPVGHRDGHAVSASESRSRQRGQALVEFAFGIIVFLTLLIGIVDLARASFMFNGVSEAAREIARETSVHPGTGALGDEPRDDRPSSRRSGAWSRASGRRPTSATTSPASCRSDACQPGDWVRVTASTTFQPALPFLAGARPVHVHLDQQRGDPVMQRVPSQRLDGLEADRAARSSSSSSSR